MAELKFSCPHCGQHIQCDELWGGHQIQCPACHGDLTVPAQVSAPTPMAAPPPAPPARPSSQPAAPRRPLAPPQTGKMGRPLKVALIAVVAIVCGVGGYFGFGFLTDLQNKTNEKRREIEKKSDGGEMGHTLAIYDALDRTEPGGPGFGGRRVTGPRQRQNGAARAIPIPDQGDASVASAPEKPLPVIPAVYTMDVETAVVPEGQVNGLISGANFVVETVRVDADAGGAQVLRLIQGPIASPDREMLVYLHLKAGETLVGHTWKISKETKGAAMPSVAKRWKSNPKYAPDIKSFSFGYAMKLELGQMTENGEIPGKIFLALPDKEQSVAAGLFKIRTALYDSDETAFPQSSKGLTPAQKALLRNR
jgi:hypothetical protein